MTRFLAKGYLALSFGLFNSLIVSSLIPSFAVAHSAIVKEGYLVTDSNHKWYRLILEQPDLTIDHVHQNQFEVWGPAGLGRWLERNHAHIQVLSKPHPSITASYPTFEQITNDLRQLTQANPLISKLFSIGKSTEGRDLWVVKISRNVATDDQRPEFKFIANMHGDEIVGREIMLRLIHELIEKDGRDQQITNLVNTTQIYIMPSMNPDGAFHQTRGSAKYIDLNRDFPDFNNGDTSNSSAGRAVETQALMKWQATHQFKLSANFHGGAEVVNYPWDAIPDPHPLDGVVKQLSFNYAKLAPYIRTSTIFNNGITNGYAWYPVFGGMQDWSFHWFHDIQLTIELSNNKWPAYSTIEYYWQQNRASLFDLMDQAHQLYN